MKKEYESPKAEKMEFDYTESVVASGCGGVYRQYTNNTNGCSTTPTENWFGGYSAEGKQ